jgi:hypothetical protein
MSPPQPPQLPQWPLQPDLGSDICPVMMNRSTWFTCSIRPESLRASVSA